MDDQKVIYTMPVSFRPNETDLKILDMIADRYTIPGLTFTRADAIRIALKFAKEAIEQMTVK